MKETDHAWAAGIVDGEGCIALRAHGQGPYHKKYYMLYVIVTQCGYKKPEMLIKLLDLYGGTIKGPYTRKNRPNILPKWEWSIAAAKAETFLRYILPYMAQKNDQVEIALKHRETAVNPGGGWKKNDQEKLEANREFARLLSKAKHPTP